MTAAAPSPVELKSDSSDLPHDLYELASAIYTARIQTAWGKHSMAEPPPRQRYGHYPTAEFDLAIACAKAVMKRYELVEKAS